MTTCAREGGNFRIHYSTSSAATREADVSHSGISHPHARIDVCESLLTLTRAGTASRLLLTHETPNPFRLNLRPILHNQEDGSLRVLSAPRASSKRVRAATPLLSLSRYARPACQAHSLTSLPRGSLFDCNHGNHCLQMQTLERMSEGEGRE